MVFQITIIFNCLSLSSNFHLHPSDVDECKDNPDICGRGAKCVNLDGGYECSQCPAGTSLNKDKTKCVGIDEIVKPEKCYAAKVDGVCKAPLGMEISRKKCCCENVGKAFGDKCEMCPAIATSELVKCEMFKYFRHLFRVVMNSYHRFNKYEERQC